MDKIVEQVIQRSSDRLKFEEGSPYTQEGFDALKIEISSYINDLINESYKTAKRSKSDLISKSHIETAAFKLIKKHSSEKKQIWSSIGGFLFGFSVSKTFEIIADRQQFDTTNTITLLACGILGAFVIGVTLFRPKD